MRSRLLASLLFAALPQYMTDTDAAAAPADAQSDTAADAAGAEGETVAAASTAADFTASGTASSAPPASTGADTASAAATDADVADAAPAAVDATPAVNIDVEDHAEARERFAGVLAKLHSFEEALVADVRAELIVLGTLLHLHSSASGTAAATGDYKPDSL